MSGFWISILILGIINMFTFLAVTIILCFEYDDNPPIFCQQHLWIVLDDYNINQSGKLILCILTIPFTIMYTVGMIVIKSGRFVVLNIWKLFCMLFQKK
jgi:hypothetical protein